MENYKMGDCLWELLVATASNRDHDEEEDRFVKRAKDFNPLDWQNHNQYDLNDPYYD
jgi:hypothetical protein